MMFPEDLPLGLRRVLSQRPGALEGVIFRAFLAPACRASEAAALLDCPLGAVVKSLVFQGDSSESSILALVSGKNRADTSALSRHFTEQVRQADPQAVLLHTGFPVGSVPPFGLKHDCPVIIDRDLLRFPVVWAAAGSEYQLMGMPPALLVELSGGQVADIKA